MSSSFLDQVRDPDAPPLVRREVRRETTFRPYATAEGEGGPLKIGEVLREAVHLYKAKFPALWLLALIVYLPVAIWFFLSESMGPALSMPTFFWIFNSVGQNGWQWVILDAVYLCFSCVWCIAALRQEESGFREKLIRGLKYLFPAIGMMLVYNLVLALGLLFLLVPGLMIATFAAVLIPALVAGDRKKNSDRIYGWQMVSGYGWTVFGILAILYVFDVLVTVGTRFVFKFVWSPMLSNLHDFLMVTITSSVSVAVTCSLYVILHRKKFGAPKDEIANVFA